MNDIGVDEWVNVGASTLAGLACLAFAVTYHLRVSWWRSEVGRNLMAFAVAVAALCVYTVLATLMKGDDCALMALRIFRTVVLLSVAALILQRRHLLLKAQRESRDRTGV